MMIVSQHNSYMFIYVFFFFFFFLNLFGFKKNNLPCGSISSPIDFDVKNLYSISCYKILLRTVKHNCNYSLKLKVWRHVRETERLVCSFCKIWFLNVTGNHGKHIYIYIYILKPKEFSNSYYWHHVNYWKINLKLLIFFYILTIRS